MMPLHRECTMGELLIRCIEQGGDAIAFASNGKPTTYREFGALLSRMVQLFEGRGLRRGDGIACLAANSMEAFLVGAACYMTGIRITNLHPLASVDDQAFMLADCGARILFFDPHSHRESAMQLSGRMPALQMLALGQGAGADYETRDALTEAARFEAAPLVSTAEPDDLCWIIYTGGTTGRPKGVMHSHRTHVALTMAQLAEWEWPERPIFLAITPISHGAGACLLPVLLRSGTIVMENGFGPAKFFEAVRRHGVTATFLVPTMIHKLLDHAAAHDTDGDIDGGSLSLVIYGAAPMPPARLREAVGRFGPIFMQLYGQSEAPNCVTVLRKHDHLTEDDRRLGSCGRPIFTSQVALLDEAGQEVPAGEIGEICVRGPLVMEGYWNRPEETEKAFRHGWLHTGDMAQRDEEGFLYIVGRSKDMIISGGFNVYPAEIEDVLAAHPAVSAAAVIGVADPTWGEAVTAVVVLRHGQDAAEADLVACVKQAKGSVYAPKAVHFIDELPVTSLGKPDKKALRDRFKAALS
ncbi:AMP-binding protein [Azospirillum endophyticum]